MLEGLDSEDPKVQDAAQKRVDAYLNDKQRKWDEDMLNKKVDFNDFIHEMFVQN